MNTEGRPKKAGEWRANVVLVIVSVVIAVIAGELVARAFFPSWAPRTGRLTKFWQYDADLGWAHRPNQEGTFTSFGFDTFVRINSHGFRGPERNFERAPNQQRVVVLGDSFVWGFGVQEDEMFTQLIDENLGDGIEVVNLGVSGYSTDQELLLYRDLGSRYAADLVVLVVAANDVALNVEPLAYVIYPKPVFEMQGASLRLTNHPVPTKSWLERSVVDLAAHSYLLNQLNRARETWRLGDSAQAVPPARSRLPNREFPKTPAERVTIRLIEQLRSEVEAAGAGFLVVLVDNIYGGQMFYDALEERSIDYVALDDVMPDGATDLHLPDNMHWTPKGHVLAAGAVEKGIVDALARSAN